MPSASRNEGEGAAGRSITVEMEELRVARETAVREALGRHMGHNYCEVCGSIINGVGCVCSNEI